MFYISFIYVVLDWIPYQPYTLGYTKHELRTIDPMLTP